MLCCSSCLKHFSNFHQMSHLVHHGYLQLLSWLWFSCTFSFPLLGLEPKRWRLLWPEALMWNRVASWALRRKWHLIWYQTALQIQVHQNIVVRRSKMHPGNSITIIFTKTHSFKDVQFSSSSASCQIANLRDEAEGQHRSKPDCALQRQQKLWEKRVKEPEMLPPPS